MTHAGLDTSQFPGLKLTAALRARTNAEWLAYYLVAPSHPNAGWRGQRAALVAQGWGLAPVYVGEETTGPGSHNVTAAQGAINGDDAADKMVADGFAPRSCGFLDLENGPPYGQLEGGHVSAWCTRFAARGFTPGIYCSHLMADEVSAQNPGARIWVFKVPTEERTAAISPFPAPALADSGFAPAALWQRQQNVWLPGFGLLVDLDVADTSDPSAPGA